MRRKKMIFFSINKEEKTWNEKGEKNSQREWGAILKIKGEEP